MYKEYLSRSKSRTFSKYHHQEKLTSFINKKTIRYHLDKLIRGFNILPEIRTPWSIVKHVTKTLFWAAVYLAFSYLTVAWSFKVIQQYHDDQTTTIMKAVINNNVTYLPNMTICFKIDTSELFNISSTSSLNYMSAWSQFFEETVSRKGIFKLNKRQVYDDEIYLSLLKYLAMVYEAERGWEPGLTQISTFHSETSDDWIALKKVLVPNIKRYNITLGQLKSVFDGKFCSLPKYRSNSFYSFNHLLQLDYAANWETHCIAGSKISFIGMDTICFRLIGYKNRLERLGKTDEIGLYPYQDPQNRKWCQEITVDIGSESRSTPRRATTRNETYAYYCNHFPGKVGINMDIGVKALYRKLPYVKGDIQCSSDTNREECENKCLRGWIRANCRCSPVTFNLTDLSRYRNCTVDDYSVCLKKYAENATYLCTNKCVPLCEQWHYELSVESPSPRSEINLNIKTFDYIIIEQVFTWNSFEEFIGALGGALGIWLGLDFVIIIEFIVKLVRKLFKKIFLRNVHDSEEEKHEESVNIKHREEDVERGISSSIEVGSCADGHQNEYKENESKITGTSIRQINEKQRTSRKKREITAWEEKQVYQRRKRPNNNKVDCAILDNKMNNTDASDGRLRNQKVNINDVDAVQEEYTAQAYNSNDQSWFLQKMFDTFLNTEASTKKLDLFLRLVEKLFWTTVYLVGSVFTTLWCVELINLYLTDAAVYYPSLVSNRTFPLPPPSLCIRYDHSSASERHENISDALEEYFDQSDINKASFVQTHDGKAWSKPLIFIVLFYFHVLTFSETDSEFRVSFNYNYEARLYASTGGDPLLRNDLNKSLNDILLPKLSEWDVTANELRQKLGVELARIVELKISFTNSNGKTDIVNETSFYTATITRDFFCFSLPYAVNFTDPKDELEFSINRASYPKLLSSWNNDSYIMFSDYLLEPESSQFSIRYHSIRVYDYPYTEFTYGEVKRTLISTDGFYTSRPEVKGVAFCSPNTTKSYCRAQCRIALIEKLCDCSPVYWTMMIQPTSGLDECTIDRYFECLYTKVSDDLECRDSCLSVCTAKYFQIDSITNYLYQENEDIAVATFSVEDGIYVLIDENPIFTLSNFLTKFGGTLGILLGLSTFTFYQVLVTTTTLCLAFILKRTGFAHSAILLKSLEKIKKSGIAQLISYLNRQLRVMNICVIMKNIKMKEIGKSILLKTGYMIGLYSTVRMSNELYCSLKIGEPKCIVDLMMNVTIKLPSWTICTPVNTVELLSESEISHFEDNIDMTRYLYSNSLHGKKEFLSKHWPVWLIQWVYECLIIYDTVERHNTQKLISTLLIDSDSSALNESKNGISHYSFISLMELDEFIDHLNITIPELKQNLGQKMREIYKTEAVFVNEIDGELSRTNLNITHTTFIGEAKVCYKLPLDTVTFNSKSDYILISFDRGSLPNPLPSSYWTSITVDFSGRDVRKEESDSDSMFGSTQSFFIGETYLAKLDISKIYEAMPVSSGVRHCSVSISMDTCLDECQQKKIERICNCSSTTQSSLPSTTNLTRCHLIDYRKCAEFLIKRDVDLCELSCVPHCKRTRFKDKPGGNLAWIKHNVTNIFLSMNSFEYLNIKEVYKYTTTEFISEFGGILSLWVGLDILAFIDLFYWLVCKGCYIFRPFYNGAFPR